MSLNWDATKLNPKLLTYSYETTEGNREEQGCPKLNRFIWLTLSINRNMTGGPKAKAEFIKRFKSLALIRPSLLTIEAGKLNLKGNEEFWKGHEETKHGFRYMLTVEDVETYWGLETNVWGRERYSKWLVRIMEQAIRD